MKYCEDEMVNKKFDNMALTTMKHYQSMRNERMSCKKCGRPNHTEETCWNNLKCGNCGRKGHPTDQCYQKHPCRVCGEKGHGTHRCYYDPKNIRLRPEGWKPKICYG